MTWFLISEPQFSHLYNGYNNTGLGSSQQNRNYISWFNGEKLGEFVTRVGGLKKTKIGILKLQIITTSSSYHSFGGEKRLALSELPQSSIATQQIASKLRDFTLHVLARPFCGSHLGSLMPQSSAGKQAGTC